MSGIRLNRLKNDYDSIQEVFDKSKYIKFKVLEGNPPSKYLITYYVDSYISGPLEPKKNNIHEVEVYLSSEYPRLAPSCTLYSPHFHPNIFENNKVCLGIWAAELPLTDLIIWIGQMLQYQNYNLQDPANLVAREWALKNENLFPVDNKNLGQLREIPPKWLYDNVNPVDKTNDEDINIHFEGSSDSE